MRSINRGINDNPFLFSKCVTVRYFPVIILLVREYCFSSMNNTSAYLYNTAFTKILQAKIVRISLLCYCDPKIEIHSMHVGFV
jgi:hypothetical protein